MTHIFLNLTHVTRTGMRQQAHCSGMCKGGRDWLGRSVKTQSQMSMQKKYFLLPNSGGQVCLSYSLLQHEVWFSFDFMPVNAAGTSLRRKWNRSEEIKAANETNVWRNDPSVRGDCSISKHYNHKFTNLLHMLVSAASRFNLIHCEQLIRTIVSLLLMAEPVHLAMTLSMHFLWMAALHSKRQNDERNEIYERDGIIQTSINGK